MAGLLVVPDGLQATLMGALRGFRDVWPATFRYLLIFWGVMVRSATSLVSLGTVARPNCLLPHCLASLSPALYLRFDSARFREPWSALRRDKIPKFDFFTTRHKARV